MRDLGSVSCPCAVGPFVFLVVFPKWAVSGLGELRWLMGSRGAFVLACFLRPLCVAFWISFVTSVPESCSRSSRCLNTFRAAQVPMDPRSSPVEAFRAASLDVKESASVLPFQVLVGGLRHPLRPPNLFRLRMFSQLSRLCLALRVRCFPAPSQVYMSLCRLAGVLRQVSHPFCHSCALLLV